MTDEEIEYITVCDKCFTQSCLKGEMMCWEARTAGTKKIKVSKKIKAERRRRGKYLVEAFVTQVETEYFIKHAKLFRELWKPEIGDEYTFLGEYTENKKVRIKENGIKSFNESIQFSVWLPSLSRLLWLLEAKGIKTFKFRAPNSCGNPCTTDWIFNIEDGKTSIPYSLGVTKEIAAAEAVRKVYGDKSA